MKCLSAAIIVAAGVALVSSSQLCFASLVSLTPLQSIAIARHGWGTGMLLIISGMLGWAYTLLSRTDSSYGSDSTSK